MRAHAFEYFICLITLEHSLGILEIYHTLKTTNKCRNFTLDFILSLIVRLFIMYIPTFLLIFTGFIFFICISKQFFNTFKSMYNPSKN